MEHPIAAVVILNYNGRKYLERFLPSVVKYTVDYWTKIYVADNASTDDSVSFLQQNFPEITIIKFDKNYGYAEGYNQALRQIKAVYYVLLNSDVEVTKDWLQPLINIVKSDEKIAAAQPKILDFNRRDYFEYAGAAGGHMDILGYPFCLGRVFDHIEKDDGQYNEQQPVFWASGACFIVDATVFHRLGGFDGDFFAHQEEIDFCWRILRSGYEVWSCPQSRVYHIGGGTLNYQNPQKVFLNFRNNLFVLTKNLPATWLILILPQRLILDGLAAIYMFFKEKSFAPVWAVIKAHFAFYASVFTLVKKRKAIRLPNKLPFTMYKKSVLWKYYVQGKKTARDILTIQ